MDQEGDCNFSTSAGFTEPAVYLQTDGLGSLTSLINSTRGFTRSAFLAERTRYDAFGQPTFQNPGPDRRADTADDVLSDRSAFNHPYAFTGREWDPESGLYYYRARYYDPKLGRFLQEDPVGGVKEFPASQHQFSYALNSPVRYSDPTGEFVPLVFAVIGVGALVSGGIEAAAAFRSGGSQDAILSAFGRGATAGAAGTTAGLIAGISGNPFVVGATAAFAANVTDQLIQNQGNFNCLNLKSAGTSALLGGVAGPLTSRIPGLKLQGRRPDLLTPRPLSAYGRNSLRLTGQEAVSGTALGVTERTFNDR